MKNLNELLATAVGWEEQLSAYFDALEIAIPPTVPCRNLLTLLKSSHTTSYTIILSIHAEDFGADEWVKCTPDAIDPVDCLIPIRNIPQAEPKVLLEHLLAYELEIQKFFTCIAEQVKTRDQQELFESLATSKERQIIELKSCLEYEGSI